MTAPVTAKKKRGPAPGGPQQGGNKPGSLHERTVQHQEAMAEEARQIVADAKARGRKLAKDVLDDCMQLFVSMAAAYQPNPPGRQRSEPGWNPFADERQFLVYAELARDTAKDLAKYQSPTFRAIVVAPPPSKNGGDGKPGRIVTRFTMEVFEDKQARRDPKVVEGRAVPVKASK